VGRKIPADTEIVAGKLDGAQYIFQVSAGSANAHLYDKRRQGFHRMLRKYTKTKAIYPTDDAVRKSVYLSIQEISRKWTVPLRDWGRIIGQLSIFFEGRFPA
jgi:hypothetical protein